MQVVNSGEKRSVTSLLRDLLGTLVLWRCAFGVSMTLMWFQRELLAFLFVGWFLMAAATQVGRIRNVLRASAPLGVFIIVNASVEAVAQGGISAVLVNYCIIWMLYVLGGFYSAASPRVRVLVLAALAFDSLTIMFLTLGALERSQNVVRLASTAEGLSTQQASDSPGLVASFSLVYALALLAIFMFSCALRLHNHQKVLVLVACLGASWWVYRTAFAIAVGLLLIFAVVDLLSRAAKVSILGKVVILSSLCVGLLAAKESLSTVLLQLVSSGSLGEILSSKAMDLAVGLTHGNGSMEDNRLTLYEASVRTFFANPVFGVDSFPAAGAVIGNHSSWLDGLGMFGIVRFLPFLIFLARLRQPFGPALSGEFQSAYDSAYLALIVMGFLNPVIFPQLWMIILVVIPFCVSMLDRSEWSPTRGRDERPTRVRWRFGKSIQKYHAGVGYWYAREGARDA